MSIFLHSTIQYPFYHNILYHSCIRVDTFDKNINVSDVYIITNDNEKMGCLFDFSYEIHPGYGPFRRRPTFRYNLTNKNEKDFNIIENFSNYQSGKIVSRKFHCLKCHNKRMKIMKDLNNYFNILNNCEIITENPQQTLLFFIFLLLSFILEFYKFIIITILFLFIHFYRLYNRDCYFSTCDHIKSLVVENELGNFNESFGIEQI